MSREEIVMDLLIEALIRGLDLRLGSHVRPFGGR
jgi:hypothetical protein